MAEGSRMWATSLLTILLLLPLLSAAPLDIAGDIKKVDDGMHSHDENVTRGGKFFHHNQFDIRNINISGSVVGDVVSIGHQVNIDVHGHEAASVIECKEGLSQLFKSIDSNKDGKMDTEELLRLCRQNNIPITESFAVRILTLPDETVGFNMAKFCELLKDCPSTNSADSIYFLLQLFDKESIDCKLAVWSDWSRCTVSCGGGTRTRFSNIIVQESNGGKPCKTIEEERCFMDKCPDPVDCSLTEWSEWSDCSVTCGEGQKSRTREVAVVANHGGQPCDKLEMDRHCKTRVCLAEAAPSFGALSLLLSDTITTTPLNTPSTSTTMNAIEFIDGTCYEDDGTRLLDDYHNSATNTPDECIGTCASRGYTYAGVQYRTECFCGNDEPPPSRIRPGSQCNAQCPVDASLNCGGTWRINIYTTVRTGTKFQLKGKTGEEKVTISMDGNEEDFELTTEWRTFSYSRPSNGFFSVEFRNDNGPRDVYIQGHESQVEDLLPDFTSNKAWACGTENENERCEFLRKGYLAWNGKYTYTLKGHVYVETPMINLDAGFSGEWGEIEKCSYPHFAYKMELLMRLIRFYPWGDKDDEVSIHAIRLTCTDGSTILSKSKQLAYGSWQGTKECPGGPGKSFINWAQIKERRVEMDRFLDEETRGNGVRFKCIDESWQGTKECPGKSFINGAQIRHRERRVEMGGKFFGEETCGNGVRFKCTDGSEHYPGDGHFGNWSEWKYCEDGFAVNGIQTKFYYMGLVDVRFFCAKLLPDI